MDARRRLAQAAIWAVPLVGAAYGALRPNRYVFDGSVVLLACLLTIGSVSFAVVRWRGRIDALGRPGGAAAFLAGVGVAFVTWTLAQGLVRVAWSGSGAPYLASSALVAGAVMAAFLVLTQDTDAHRILLTLGALAVGVAGWWIPGPWETIVAVGLAATTLFLAWNPAPPTMPDHEEGAPQQ